MEEYPLHSFTDRWFCHFDDDMYANIPNLMSALRSTGNESDDGVYFGRWPGEVVLDRLKKGIKVHVTCMYLMSVLPCTHTGNFNLYSRFQKTDFKNLEFWTM